MPLMSERGDGDIGKSWSAQGVSVSVSVSEKDE